MILSGICKLPLEVMAEVLNFLNLEETSALANVSTHFERAVCYKFKIAIHELRARLNKKMRLCLEKLQSMSLSEEHLRMDFIKLLSHLRFILTEVDLLVALVWRYSSLNSAWKTICPYIAPVVEEFNSKISEQASYLQINYNFQSLLPKWNNFLKIYDTDLVDKLNTILPNAVDFETMAIDILTCCPSINFQIAFKRLIAKGNDRFNIYAFFKLNHLKPACQIPSVHNSQLNTTEKKHQLLKFLRECIQWENYIFLQEFMDEIFELEMRLWLPFDIANRDYLISYLQERYRNIQVSPYKPIQKCVGFSHNEDGRHWNEYYCRFSTCNENFTGLRCIIDTPNQQLENLPFIFSVFRRWKRNSLHDIINAEEMISFDNIGSHFNLISLRRRKTRIKPKFQLIIRYRERLFSSPAEAIINLTYDEHEDGHITSDFIESEPFPPGVGNRFFLPDAS